MGGGGPPPVLGEGGSLGSTLAAGAAAGDAAAEAGSLLRAARTALFSLGNLASLPACRAALEGLGLPGAVRPLAVHLDPPLRQHAARLLQKLGEPGPAAALLGHGNKPLGHGNKPLGHGKPHGEGVGLGAQTPGALGAAACQ